MSEKQAIFVTMLAFVAAVCGLVLGACAMDGPRRGPPGGGMVRRRDFYGRVWIWMGWRWRTVGRGPAHPARAGQ